MQPLVELSQCHLIRIVTVVKNYTCIFKNRSDKRKIYDFKSSSIRFEFKLTHYVNSCSGFGSNVSYMLVPSSVV